MKQRPTSLNLVGLSLLVMGSCSCADAIQWIEFHQAVREARRQGKMLLVVQGPDDVSLPHEECGTAQAIHRAALADHRVKDFYSFRVVATYRATGPPKLPVAKPGRSANDKGSPSHPNVMTYFCGVSPQDEVHVLHFVVGYPTPIWLQAQCDWAHAAFESIKDDPIEYARSALADMHRKRLLGAGESVPTFAVQPTLLASLKLAAQFRDQRLLSRFGANWTATERKQLIGSLRPHAELQPLSGHQVLCLHSFVKLSELEPFAFPLLTRQPYWSPPQRREQVIDWFRQQRKKQRALIIVLSPTDAPGTQELGQGLWQPRRKSVRHRLRSFDTIEVSRTELVCLLRDAKLRIPDRAIFKDLKFGLLGKSGSDITWLTDDDELRLYRMMERKSDG